MKINLQKILSIVTVLLFFERANAQDSLVSRLIMVHKVNSNIVVDGDLNEEMWQLAAVADSFINKWPTDNGKAKL
jgi:hypothetical protein